MQWYSEIINQEMKRQELLKCSESAILVFFFFFLKNSAFLKRKKNDCMYNSWNKLLNNSRCNFQNLEFYYPEFFK